VSKCEECGYDRESPGRVQIVRALGPLAEEHRVLLTTIPAERLRDHPRPGSWSVLEYGCHVRDVLRFQRERIALAQAEDTPAFTSMRPDERAAEERYNEQDPRQVARDITAAARELTGAVTGLDAQGWQRTGVYPFPSPEVHTAEWVVRFTAHELAHHLFDSRRLMGLDG
jgi:S-DNA-T family DNA segregation ATPase FtsK/SpoIIIE